MANGGERGNGGDRAGPLRARDGGDQPVTRMELFFDLVFVFAVTQLSHLLAEHLDLYGAAQTLLLLVAVWRAWIDTAWVTNWFDPDRPAVRLMLVGVMLTSLIMTDPATIASVAVVLSGPILFLIGHLLYKHAVSGRLLASHLTGIVALVALAPLGLIAVSLVVATAATVVVGTVAAWDTRTAWREQTRSEAVSGVTADA